jgi:acetyltransferase-like isoleucine patch superfamily enzyme
MRKKIFKILLKIFPHALIFGAMNFLVKIKYNVSIGKGSKVYLDSFFEGHNAVFSNTEVQGSYIGLCTYIAHNSKIGRAKIGRFCAIGDNLRIFISQHPSKKFVSIHPMFYTTKKLIDITFSKTEKFEYHTYIDSAKKYVVEIGNDVWIGNNVLIMDGIKIGDGAIIAAGAIVTKDVDPYAIIGGVPAKLIRYRFTEEQIKFLLNLKWWDKDLNWIKNNYKSFSDIEIFINKYENEFNK